MVSANGGEREVHVPVAHTQTHKMIRVDFAYGGVIYQRRGFRRQITVKQSIHFGHNFLFARPYGCALDEKLLDQLTVFR